MTRLPIVLLVSASALGLSAPAAAQRVVFASDARTATAVAQGARVHQDRGVTQVRLDNGAVASVVDAADFQVSKSGIAVFAGSVTVAGGGGGLTSVQLADKGTARIAGGSSANFGVARNATGATEVSGHVIAGEATVALADGPARTFGNGQLWKLGSHRAERVVANPVAAVPQKSTEPARVTPLREAGAAGAAANGVPVVLGEALAAAGASGDVVSAARRVEAAVAQPSLRSFPAGDLQQLVGYAAQLQTAYGGKAFPGAGADIVQTYLQYLAKGGAGQSFLSAYAAFLTQYLDVLRSGAAPASFAAASQPQINAFIAYQGRTSGFGALSSQNQALVSAYLQFLQTGGDAAKFTSSYTDLVNAYLAYVRTGADPAAFTSASQATVNAYLAFLRDSGLVQQLTSANQALVSAYLQSLASGGNGLAFASQYQSALSAYFAFLQQGNPPSAYTAVNAATLRQYLETLQSTGLLQQVLGAQASFYADYLAYLQKGGAIDAYAQLPANLYPQYASALQAYYAYLLQGGLPSRYAALTQAQLLAYYQALAQADVLAKLVTAEQATFLLGYSDYLAGGGNPDKYASLPAQGTGGGSTGGGTTGGGTTGGTGSPTGTLTSYTGGFPTGSGATLFLTSKDVSGLFADNPQVAANGTFSTKSFLTGTATAVDVAGDSRGVIGRFQNGTFTIGSSSATYGVNDGLSYAVMAPIVGSLPSSGTIDYTVLAATRPVYSDGHTAPGTFAANLTVGFGTSLRFGLDGSITMPDATYTLSTSGRSSGQLVGAQVSNPTFFVIRPTLSATGPACSGSGCFLNLYGSFGGANPQERLGFSYTSAGSSSTGPAVQGSVYFGSAASTPTTPTTSATPAAPTGAGLEIRSVGLTFDAGTTTRYAEGTFVAGNAALVSAADGTLSQTFFGNATNTLGTATNAEFGTAGGAIGWSRWTGGRIGSTAAGHTSQDIPTNGAVAQVWGTPATNVPTTGVVQYTMVGATKPALVNGSAAPGTLNSASFAVDFAKRTADFGASLAVNGTAYAINALGMSIDPGSNFTGLVSNAHVFGFLAGAGAGYAGVSYNLFGPGVVGVVAFKGN